jgi:hypothetical protein
MVTRVLCVLAVLLGSVASASAQTHPCDVTPTSQTIPYGVPHKVQFCSPKADNVEATVAYVDGIASALMPVTAVGTPNGIGLQLYETALFLNVSKGNNHVLEVSAYNRDAAGVSQNGPKSPPFVFAVVDANPLTVSSLTADKPAPQAVGSAITLTATATGGTGPYSFKWYISLDGGATWDFFTWWQAENIKVWTPTAACDCRLKVWARSADTPGDVAEAESTVLAFTITATPVVVVPRPGAPTIRGVTR